ncbi:MAG TPA: protein TolR [Lentisphaeria bacterium]|jgi:biopolymer transport protein TolR|nr:biopolymer transporter ExbD [Lentisphaeria bacterium]HCG27469.1 protein TolR [Lentisphaeria bacterium]HCG48443.1 protein TolR [Lentisphaeria bacterium]
MRRRFQSKSYDEINITPLMDTVFFLLIIFMITAPLLEYSIDVSPPKMNASEMKPDEYSRVINVKKNGDIEFEKKIMNPARLIARLRELKASPDGGRIKVFLRADKDLLYGSVIQVMKDVKNAGFTDISLITEVDK